MEINGLPLHPLVVHAVVVLVPTTALVGLAYALVPRWRWLLRWPLLAVSVVAAGASVLAASSGQSLVESRPGLEALVDQHRSYGQQLRNLALVAHLIVESARRRKESRGIHYTLDYPDKLPEARDTDIHLTDGPPAS